MIQTCKNKKQTYLVSLAAQQDAGQPAAGRVAHQRDAAVAAALGAEGGGGGGGGGRMHLQEQRTQQAAGRRVQGSRAQGQPTHRACMSSSAASARARNHSKEPPPMLGSQSA